MEPPRLISGISLVKRMVVAGAVSSAVRVLLCNNACIWEALDSRHIMSQLTVRDVTH
jgi:hypothetical protein